MRRLPALLLAVGLALLGRPSILRAEAVTAIPGTEVTSAQHLSLEQCIDLALGVEGNAALRAERERRRELDGQMGQARATGLPTLDLSGTWSRGRDPSFAFNSTFGGDGVDAGGTGNATLDSLLAGFSFIPAPEDIAAQTFWRSSLNARWELRPGLVFNAVGAAGLGIERQDAAVRGAEHRAVETVMTSYHALVAQAENLAALDADLAAKREFLSVTRKRQALGLSTPLDTLRAAVALANLEPERRNAAQNLRDAGARLNLAMGREPLTPLTVTGEQAVELDPLPARVPAAAVAARSDLRQIELLQSILRKNRGAQKAQHRPYLSADASYGYVTSEFDQLFDTGHDFWSASVTLTVPLFDGLSTRGKVTETEASIRRTGIEYRDALRQAELELESTLGALAAARETLLAASLNEQAAAEALAQTQQRYGLGKADYLSVLDAQTQHRLARQNGIAARSQVLGLTATVKRLLGHDPREALGAVLDALPAADAAASGR